MTLPRTITQLLIEDLQDREVYGTHHYGVPLLEDNTKKDALKEAYEEAMDLCIYLRLELERRSNGRHPQTSTNDGTRVSNQ